MNRTVLKLGGSLLQLPDVAERLKAFVNQFDIEWPVVVTGGGELADVIRTLDRRFQLSQETSHRLAIETMSMNAQILASLDEGFSTALPVLGHCCDVKTIRIPDVRAFLPDDGSSAVGTELPSSWDVTSDSIAAFLATEWKSEHLILLKSADLTVRRSQEADDRFVILQQLCDSGVVDPYFVKSAAEIARCEWCNLSSSSLQLEKLW